MVWKAQSAEFFIINCHITTANFEKSCKQIKGRHMESVICHLSTFSNNFNVTKKSVILVFLVLYKFKQIPTNLVAVKVVDLVRSKLGQLSFFTLTEMYRFE